ncbi:hypothetical protein D3C84_498990 [compost metagenome]|jgi:hypothetical protein
MRRITLLLMLLLLTACATEAKYQNMLNALKGVDELTLIRRWGPPDQVYESQGHRFLVYRYNETVVVPGAAPMYQTTFSGKTAYTHSYGGSPDTIMSVYCATTFEIADGKVFAYSFRGSNCTSN